MTLEDDSDYLDRNMKNGVGLNSHWAPRSLESQAPGTNTAVWPGWPHTQQEPSSLRLGSLWHFHVALGLARGSEHRGERGQAQSHRMHHWVRTEPLSASSIGPQLINYPQTNRGKKSPSWGLELSRSYKAWSCALVETFWNQTSAFQYRLTQSSQGDSGKACQPVSISVFSTCIFWGASPPSHPILIYIY